MSEALTLGFGVMDRPREPVGLSSASLALCISIRWRVDPTSTLVGDTMMRSPKVQFRTVASICTAAAGSPFSARSIMYRKAFSRCLA